MQPAYYLYVQVNRDRQGAASVALENSPPFAAARRAARRCRARSHCFVNSPTLTWASGGERATRRGRHDLRLNSPLADPFQLIIYQRWGAKPCRQFRPPNYEPTDASVVS